MLRTIAYLLSRQLAASRVSLCRSAAADLDWYARHGRSRYPSRNPQLIMLGPVAITRPLRTTALGVWWDLEAAWTSARAEVEINQSWDRASAAASLRDRLDPS